jgi:hypothetical protein
MRGLGFDGEDPTCGQCAEERDAHETRVRGHQPWVPLLISRLFDVDRPVRGRRRRVAFQNLRLIELRQRRTHVVAMSVSSS